MRMVFNKTQMSKHFWLISLLTIGSFLPGRAMGQQIKANFTIHLETLPLTQQEDMRGFQQKLVDYIEGWDWLKERLRGPVQFNMEAFLAYQGSVVKTQYGSKLTVSNGLDIKYLDRWWFFEFEKDDILKHDDRQFHSLTWLIDYYVHLIIGSELDKYSEFGGDEHFEKAQRIGMDGRFSSDYQKGWDERTIVINNLISDEYKPYRRLRWLFYHGTSLYKARSDEESKQVCRQAVELLASLHTKNPKDERLKDFFAAHYLELGEVFKTDTSPDVYELLILIDPDHKKTYTEYMDHLKKE